MEEIKDKIQEILEEILDGQDYEECDDFLEEGLMDSMDVMDLVDQLELTFEIEISGRDILPENFKNVETITSLVQKYTQEA